MNWPILLAQSADEIKKIVSEQNNGTSVPDHALARPAEASSNWFSSGYWFPESASTFSANIDWLFMFIFWISLIFFAVIVGVMVHFCIKYRRKGDEINPEPSSSHNTQLEIAWSVGPSILLVVMFWYGAEGWYDMRYPRSDAEEIQVTASRWNWKFTYPDGDSSTELHLVNNRPTKLVMQSTDVLHSMYIASMRQKVDIVPGRYTFAYLEPQIGPDQDNKFRLACTEYCGQKHSKMRTMVTVHADDDRRKADTEWIEAEKPAWQNGERIYKINCSGCHNSNDVAATGPAFGNLWAKKKEVLMGGKEIEIDQEYIKNSIWFPNQDIVEGYGPVSKMNSFKGKLTLEDIDQLIAYLKYLDDPTSVSDKPEGEVKAGDKPQDSEEAAPAEDAEKTST